MLSANFVEGMACPGGCIAGAGTLQKFGIRKDNIDRYAQDCLRVLMSGQRTKGRFNVRYEDLKKLGYRSLVHEYYAFNTKS